MQTVAQAYLILFPLHGTGVDVAIATSLQFLPLLLLGPFGGLIADRVDKRKVLYATQVAAGVLALILGAARRHALGSSCGRSTCWSSRPRRSSTCSTTRRARPSSPKWSGSDLLPNAVSLNSVLMNSARVIGPAIGGVLILTFGVATCFFINAASYAAVIVALWP